MFGYVQANMNTLTEEEFLVVSALEQEKLTPKMKLKILEFWK